MRHLVIFKLKVYYFFEVMNPIVIKVQIFLAVEVPALDGAAMPVSILTAVDDLLKESEPKRVVLANGGHEQTSYVSGAIVRVEY